MRLIKGGKDRERYDWEFLIDVIVMVVRVWKVWYSWMKERVSWWEKEKGEEWWGVEERLKINK